MKMKLRNKLIVIGVSLFLILLAGGGVLYHQLSQPKITIAEEITFVTEPVGEDGYIDYVQALNDIYRGDTTPEENAAVLIWRAIGIKHAEQEHRAALCRELGETEASLRSDFVSFPEYMKPSPATFEDQEAARERISNASHTPWSAESDPELFAWLEAMREPLDLAREARQKTKYYSPLYVPVDNVGPPAISTLLPAEQHSRQLAYGLAASAMLQLNRGDYQAAADDLEACQHLGFLIGQSPPIISGIVENAIVSIALRGKLRWVEKVAKERPELLSMMETPQADSLYSTADRLDFAERIIFLDLCQHLAKNGLDQLKRLEGGPEVAWPEFAMLRTIGSILDWDLILRRVNETYDDIVIAAEYVPDDPEVLGEIQLFFDELATEAKNISGNLNGNISPNAISEQMAKILIGFLFPDVISAIKAHLRMELKKDLLPVSIAMQRYRNANGRYPESPQQLVPVYLESIPLDPFTGNALIYRLTDEGYMLYSVGHNFEDNGGPENGFISQDGSDLGITTPLPTSVPTE